MTCDPTTRTSRRAVAAALATAVLLGLAVSPATVLAQGTPARHGGEIEKICPAGPFAVGASYTCDIRFTNKDTFNDALTVGITDTVGHAVPETFELTTGPLGPGTVVRGGCFSGVDIVLATPPDSPRFFFRDQTCASDADCLRPSVALPLDGVCIPGVCAGGANDGGYCRATSSCPGGTCSGGICSGGTNAGRACCDCPGGSCMPGTCGPGGDRACCVGGSNAGNSCCVCSGGGTCGQGECEGGAVDGAVCTRDDCPDGSCVAGTCDAGGRQGEACAVDDCPAGRCSVTLPRQGSVTVQRTDTVEATDPDLLIDMAHATGVDQGTLLAYSLEIPAGVPVQRGPMGCRITGGGRAPDGGIDLGVFADILLGSFGGQVGAPCGCIGCFDAVDHIQGNWTYQRKSKKGSFQAKDYNSLVCGCDGVFDGELCNAGDRGPGPEPPRAPANMACFTGVGTFAPTGGRRADPVAFRVDIEDRGEPGTDDVFKIKIWTLQSGENAQDLAERACCGRVTLADLEQRCGTGTTIRCPNINDGGKLISGNLQIHPVLPKTEDGICPPPRTACPAPLP